MNRRKFMTAVAIPAAVAARPGALFAAAAPSASPALPQDDDAEFWEKLRDQFYLSRGEAYFNTGTLGAVPRPVLERVIEEMRTLQITLAEWDYTARTQNYLSGYSPALELRAKMGRLINADAMEIAIVQNATFGMNFLANGMDLKDGDEVITTNQEHPCGVCGWQMRAKRNHCVWKQVEIPVPANDPDEIVRRFEQAITPRTRVVSVPHIISATAVVMPVERLAQTAHQHGCLFVVDGAQAIGQVEVDVKRIGCDAYYSSPHKWLLAPQGNGVLYIARDKQELFWTTLCSSEWDNAKDGMFRFMQYGTGNRSIQTGLDAALDFHFLIGPEKIRKRIRFLADRLRAGLQQIPGAKINSPVHPDMAGAVVVYALDGVPTAKLEDEFWYRKRMRPRSMGDPLGIRQSCQIYNNEEQIDATLEIVRDMATHKA